MKRKTSVFKRHVLKRTKYVEFIYILFHLNISKKQNVNEWRWSFAFFILIVIGFVSKTFKSPNNEYNTNYREKNGFDLETIYAKIII